MNYVQCTLRKTVKDGVKSESRYIQVSWIPKRYAVPSRMLRLKVGDTWEDGWEVVATYGEKSEEDVLIDEKAHKHMREVTDR